MIPKVAVDLLLVFSSLGLGHGAIDSCSVPLENIAAYEGVLNTLIYFPTSNNSVKWSISATTDELTEVDIVNYNDAVDPGYTADYAFNSSGLIVENATTTADYNVHQLSTAGLYTAQCGGNQFSFKFLVVRKGPTCSCSLVNPSSVQLTCSATYADYSYCPIAAVFTLYVNGRCAAFNTPQRTNDPDGYAWNSTSSFTTAYSSSSTYQCGLTFGPPTEIQDPSVAMNAPSFENYCSVTTSEFGCTAVTTTSPSACSSSITTTTRPLLVSTSSTTTRFSTSSLTSSTVAITPKLPAASSSSTLTTAKLSTSATTSTTNTTFPRSTSSSSTSTRLSLASATSSTTAAPFTAGGLSDGSKIGIGVGIGVGGTLVLVAILFAVLCTRNGNTKKAKTDDKNTIGLEEDSERSRTKQENASVPQYEPLNVLSVESSNSGSTYEQLTTSIYADVIEHSFSDRSTDENLGYKLNPSESQSSEYEGLQQKELPALDGYESLKPKQ